MLLIVATVCLPTPPHKCSFAPHLCPTRGINHILFFCINRSTLSAYFITFALSNIFGPEKNSIRVHMSLLIWHFLCFSKQISEVFLGVFDSTCTSIILREYSKLLIIPNHEAKYAKNIPFGGRLV